MRANFEQQPNGNVEDHRESVDDQHICAVLTPSAVLHAIRRQRTHNWAKK